MTGPERNSQHVHCNLAKSDSRGKIAQERHSTQPISTNCICKQVSCPCNVCRTSNVSKSFHMSSSAAGKIVRFRSGPSSLCLPNLAWKRMLGILLCHDVQKRSPGLQDAKHDRHSWLSSHLVEKMMLRIAGYGQLRIFSVKSVTEIKHLKKACASFVWARTS